MDYFLTVEQAANGYKVELADVISWIETGKLKAKKLDDGTYQIPLDEYQKFGQSMPPELTQKINEYLWRSMQRVQPEVQEKVRKRFLANSQFVLERAEQAISLMERLHKKYESGVDIFENRCGGVAAFIVFARIISLLYSISGLLRAGVISESVILFRPLWEGILLADYFAVSDALGQNKNAINRWFEKEGEIIGASTVREYLSEKLDLPLELLKKLNKGYSFAVHHTNNSIMESYRGYSMSGMGSNFSQRLGFDYHKSSIGRDLVPTVGAFENLIMASLNAFVQCFWTSLPLTDEEKALIQTEREFYSLDSLERLDKIFKKDSDQANSEKSK